MYKIFQEIQPILWVFENKKNIDFSPSYQRMGRIWNKEQKQLLMDSIINGFDIPKLYFQFMPKFENSSQIYNYAVIDGKQRLEAIFDFFENKFTLSKEFRFLNGEDENLYGDISGLSFSEIQKKSSSLISRILDYQLTIVFMETDDPNLINETFVRLNSGISVNTAEKRNASGGILAQKMKSLYMNHEFFKDTIRMTNARYAHFDLALKFLMLEMKEKDLGKKSVDKFVQIQKEFDENCEEALSKVVCKIDRFVKEFDNKDLLLSKKSLIVTLFSVLDQIPNGKIKAFLSYFETNRKVAMENADNNKTDTNMIEFTRLLQQGADKYISLNGRKIIMEKYLHKYLQEMQS